MTADGAYDTRRGHSAIIARGGTALVGRSFHRKARGSSSLPIRRNGRPWKEDGPAAKARNETLRATPGSGISEAVDRISRPQSRGGQDALAGSLEPVALNLLDLKAFGERITARDPDRQTAEIPIRVALINRFNALATAEIVRAA